MMSSNFLTGTFAAKLTFSAIVAAVFGYVAKFLGGFDNILITLITLIVIDYITGVAAAVYLKRLSSAIGYKGIIKKFLMILVVGLSVALQNVLPESLPLREITILFFIANEGLSILENTAKIIPLPKKLKAVLLQLQEKAEEKTDESTDENTESNTPKNKVKIEEDNNK